MTIKIRNNEYTIKQGDYILDNGACIQLVAGDGRILRFDGYNAFRSVVLTKKAIAQLPKRITEELKTNPAKRGLREYYF